MPPVPEPKQPVLQELAPEPLVCVQGATTLPALDAKAVAELAEGWLPAVEAPAIDETAPGDAIADAVRDLVNDGTVQAIESTVFDVVKAIADAVKDGTESEDDEQDDEDDEDAEDAQDNTPQRKKNIARKRERTPDETQPMSPEQKATPSTPDPDESQKVDKDGDDSKIMSPCKKPKQVENEQRGSDLAVMM